MYNTLMADQQPGEVIIPIERTPYTQPQQVAVPSQTPTASPPEAPIVIAPPTSAPSPDYAPQISPAPAPSATEPVVQTAPLERALYNPSQQAPTGIQTGEGIAWRSAEYMAHDKDASWYGAMVLGSALLAGIVYILNRDIVTAAIILFALIGLAYVSGRKPRDQQFEVSTDGVHVGRSYYPFHDFRSFSTTEDAAATSIVLTPLKRFMPAVNIYVPKQFEEQVVNLVSGILPFEQNKTDLIESLMRRIRF